MNDQQYGDLDVDAPPEFLCPITMSIMKDPVILPDGQTYEREAIKKALETNPISPVTRQQMDISQAKPNYSLKSLIDKYIQEHQHEIEENEKPIDPTKLNQISTPTNQIPIAHLNDIQLVSFSAQYKDDSMLISIKPQEIKGRMPVSIIAMIDVSGSMRSDASLPISGTENTTLTRLQLVQYSLKTIISVLGNEDRITLISFSNFAKVELENVLLTDDGKQRANKIIDEFSTGGCTNIWDALDKGIDQAIKEKDIIQELNKNNGDFQINTSLLLFTDGEPNRNPPMGIVPCLEKKLSELNSHFSISSFGFGYDIDSELMEDIAQLGNGIYGYCPDATMVGTIFISYMSNLISMLSPLAVIDITSNKGNQTKNKLALYNGATTNLMIPLDKDDNPNELQISLNLPLTNQNFLIKEIKPIDENDEKSITNFRDQKYRKLLIDLILNSRSDNLSCDESIQKVKDLFEQLNNEENRSQLMKNIMIDLYNEDDKHGQVERAYRNEYFKKWGKNYLFSFVRFHILEQCGNFKDMSLQLYGNDTFKKFRKIANKIFMNLPIPERKKPQNRYHDTPVFSMTMRSYNSRSLGCFNGEALVKLVNGAEKRVDQLVKGDKLLNGSKVICLVKIPTENGRSDAVQIGNAFFTPYHPVKVNIEGQKEKEWVFPVEIEEPKEIKIDFWYNIILDRSCADNKHNLLNDNKKYQATAIIGGIEAVTLGHGITEGVCKHPYFGTDKAISSLMKYKEFEDGFIEFRKPLTAKRDPITNIIIEYF